MDRNFVIAIALSFLVLIAWARFFGPDPAVEPEGGAVEQPAAAPESPPVTNALDPSGRPGVVEPAPVEAVPAQRAVEASTPAVAEQIVIVRTDLYEAELSSYGGVLKRFDLLAYDEPSIEGSPALDMVTLEPGAVGALATPFNELGYGSFERAPFHVEQPDPRTVVFTRVQDQVEIRKTYRFDPEQYLLRLTLGVTNGSERNVSPTFRTFWPAALRASNDFKEFSLASYTDGSLKMAPVAAGRSFLGFGGSSFSGEMRLPEEPGAGVDWVGTQMRYFVAALMPELPSEAAARFTSGGDGHTALAEVAYEPIELPPGQAADREYRVFLGPKQPDLLDAVGGHLDQAIQKGWFPPLTRFFVGALKATYSVVGNYGIAIILITIVVRLLMAPIMARQMRSMKKISALSPRMKEIQEKFADDRQKQSEAMMAMYKEEGVSPFSAMAGCLPMLLQLPVFIGFYYALQGDIHLRLQPFVGWIQDLSQPESLFVIPGLELPVRLLPLLMGGSMVLQQRLTPTSMDPAQARLMSTVMPVMFTLLFYKFASGLVLYWLVSNLLGVAQQLITNRSKD